MRSIIAVPLLPVCLLFAQAPVQDQGSAAQQASGSAPIYRVNVVSRTVKAVNYGHRQIPTKIDFKGTILMPDADGEAVVESRRGAVQIRAEFDDLVAPSRFGPEYMTYVLWAITPEGRATNLGELVTNRNNDAKIRVSTELQSFALIVTAEPYYAVTQPSGVVVLENHVRPDTAGKVDFVNARYELLPPREFTYDINRPEPNTKMVSMSEYESLLALYQALNAIQIGQSQGVDTIAPESFQRARQLYQQASDLHNSKGDSKKVVMLARESAQIMEDARLIAAQRREPRKP